MAWASPRRARRATARATGRARAGTRGAGRASVPWTRAPGYACWLTRVFIDTTTRLGPAGGLEHGTPLACPAGGMHARTSHPPAPPLGAAGLPALLALTGRHSGSTYIHPPQTLHTARPLHKVARHATAVGAGRRCAPNGAPPHSRRRRLPHIHLLPDRCACLHGYARRGPRGSRRTYPASNRGSVA